MFSRIRKSIILKSFLFVVLGSAILSLLVVNWYWHQINIEGINKVQIQKDEVVFALKESLIEPVRFHNVKEISKVVSAYMGRTVEWLVLIDSSGVPLFTAGNLPDVDNIKNFHEHPDLNLNEYIFSFDVVVDSELLANVYICFNLTKIKESQLVEKRNLFLSAVTLFLIGIIISGFYVQMLVKRIERLNLIIKNMSLDDLDLPDEVSDSSDEIDNIYIAYRNTNRKLYGAQVALIEQEKHKVTASIAAQVAHDIRSPLSVLNLVGKTISDELKNEHVDLFKLAIKRIQIISDDLLDKKDEYINSHISNSSLTESMLKIIQEKEYLINQSRENIKIVFNSSHSLNFDKLPIQVVERIFSNILNNSIEALSNFKNGIIEVSLTENNEKTSILIKDNGPGMSPEVLQKVCSKGFTVGKNNGNGLGLYHAKSTIEASGGVFTITSVVDIGTVVKIVF